MPRCEKCGKSIDRDDHSGWMRGTCYSCTSFKDLEEEEDGDIETDKEIPE